MDCDLHVPPVSRVSFKWSSALNLANYVVVQPPNARSLIVHPELDSAHFHFVCVYTLDFIKKSFRMWGCCRFHLNQAKRSIEFVERASWSIVASFTCNVQRQSEGVPVASFKGIHSSPRSECNCHSNQILRRNQLIDFGGLVQWERAWCFLCCKRLGYEPLFVALFVISVLLSLKCVLCSDYVCFMLFSETTLPLWTYLAANQKKYQHNLKKW